MASLSIALRCIPALCLGRPQYSGDQDFQGQALHNSGSDCMTTPIPSKIGKYEVTGVIGRGGMGVVYRATDPHLDRRVAVKMITGAFSENPDMLKRFFREAQSLGSLQHPNIVTVFDLGDYGGNPYFVMEYLEGEGLDAVMSNHRPLNLLEKIAIIIQVCNGLGYAHRRGVIHRDVKPANIMINKDGAIKIFDFG